jgi:hypothetical protein
VKLAEKAEVKQQQQSQAVTGSYGAVGLMMAVTLATTCHVGMLHPQLDLFFHSFVVESA